MKLSYPQFNILSALEKQVEKIPVQRELVKKTGYSLGTVNKTLSSLLESGLVDKHGLTSKGIRALEPFRVKRAVFIAAGFGSRLVPITLNTPKPLVRVKGVRIIDTLLDAVIKAEISEIYIVRGYLSEQFDQLLYKYPMIKFFENPLYNESNNISSVMCVRYLLQNSYILESDLYLYNPDVITKYQYKSNYIGVPVKRTDDWCFESKNGIITRLRLGGINCHHMFGISYWTKEDGARLAEHIKTVYEMPGGRENYWDQVALDYFIKEYSLEIREFSFNDIVEIDTFKDLKKLDETYRT